MTRAVTFLHAADVHLDAPLKGLSRYEAAPAERIRQAGRGAFDQLIQKCLEHRVDFLLLAGDLLDGKGQDFNTVLYLAAGFRRLLEADIEVFVVLGNHDAEHDLLREKLFPANVTLFPSSRAMTCHRPHLGVAVHGQSHANKAETRNLAAHFPPALPDVFNIGLLHTALTGRPGHESYAPCSEEDLLLLGYHYWALGHVHQREVVRARDPVILFPGTLQGRHIRETGVKGASLVEVDTDGAVRLEHMPLDLVRWHTLELGVEAYSTPDDCLEGAIRAMEQLVMEDVLLVVRLRLTGCCPWYGQWMIEEVKWERELRLRAQNVGGELLWLERVINDSTPLREQNDRGDDFALDPLQLVAELSRELIADEAGMKKLGEVFNPLVSMFRSPLFAGADTLPLTETEWLRRAIQRAEVLVGEGLRSKNRGRL
ncbi:MAG: DNA repair exonuclease [Magnetococcales bacterium]|nr:DNA repair exonuclease [Magnetococcales bacterium]